MNNVKYEYELYEPMCLWLEQYLTEQYRKAKIIVVDCHSQYLDVVLKKYGVLSFYPQIVGLKIQIDVLGIVQYRNRVEIVFIEAKKTALNLHDLGQLWAYCRLCDPIEAFLLSSKGLGSLNHILVNLRREDMLDYSIDNKKRMIKRMKVAKWNISRNDIDSHSMVPKI